MASGALNGMKVLALETRRAAEIARLIRSNGGEPTVVSAMREVPLESNHEALAFAERLLRGEFDLVVFTTGVGVRRLMEIVESRHDRAGIIDALRRAKLAARGPKAAAAIRELGLSVAVTAAEPCTWREVMASLEGALGSALKGMRAAVQEYGTPNPDLLHALTEHGIEAMRVPVYHWALPEDLEPLRDAVRGVAAGKFDAIVFLTAVQVIHLFEVAEGMNVASALRSGLGRMAVLSIGPSTSEELLRHGIHPDLEPSHPKMGFLMNEAAARAAALLEEKRRAPGPG